MILSTLALFFPYSLVTAYTPGPNNLLALNSVTMYGFRKSRNTIIGISLGFLCVMALSAVFTFFLASFLPGFVQIMKYLGAGYIVWLALHIALSKSPSEGAKKEPSFIEGFLLQFVNVKIILYAVTIYTCYVLPANESFFILMIFALIISAIGISATMVWACLGNVFQKLIRQHYRLFNVLMALLLLECAVKMLFI
ncbi:LysE family transporter [Anaerostipes sp.]|uniref:LysE family transporter n=1 Tax=Anaerostipes sp. TaxID=1872530 RepID=UPI0025BFC4CD|nr:LysE family transporter [Anaerostipes sp.]MBS7008768.1 LysE family transporter [Anaerostipes sp.]